MINYGWEYVTCLIFFVMIRWDDYFGNWLDSVICWWLQHVNIQFTNGFTCLQVFACDFMFRNVVTLHYFVCQETDSDAKECKISVNFSIYMLNSSHRTYSGLDPTICAFWRIIFLWLGMNPGKENTCFENVKVVLLISDWLIVDIVLSVYLNIFTRKWDLLSTDLRDQI